MEMQTAVTLIVLLTIIAIALRILGRQSRRVRHEEAPPVAEALAPSEVDVEEAPARSRRRVTFPDRLFGGTVAAALIGAIVFTLEVTGYGGPLSSILPIPASAFPAIAKALGPLLGGVAIVSSISFLLGFAFPRLIVR